jgi:hypothetical protein
MACRKTAVSARHVALQMMHNTIVCAADSWRDQTMMHFFVAGNVFFITHRARRFVQNFRLSGKLIDLAIDAPDHSRPHSNSLESSTCLFM